jgi:small-conductance mechanosensitive channel
MSGSIPHHRIRGAALTLLLALNAAVPASAQSPLEPAAASVAPAAASVEPAVAAVAPMTGPSIIQMLEQTIEWYRTLGVQQQAASEPSDWLILYDNRQTASEVMSLAFEIGRANAEILANQPRPKDAGGDSAASQTLSRLQDKIAAQWTSLQAELDADRHQLAKAPAAQKRVLQAKISELQGELELINARKGLLDSMSAFADRGDAGGVDASALKAQIDAMAVTMSSSSKLGPASSGAAAPNAASANSAASNTAAAAGPLAAVTGASASAAARFGIWALAANVVRLSEKITTIDAIDAQTAALQTTFAQIRAPLLDQLKTLSAKGDALAAQADSADSATLERVRAQLATLSSQFKQCSSLLIPLSKEVVLLNQYRRTLGNWRDAVKSRHRDALKTLGVRLGMLAVLLVLTFAAAEAWRRAVIRYVQDPRRRYQSLLLRRIVLWFLVAAIIGFAFASELGSIVTFAGLITAGLAVAMQSVLVSIVGYFFLIGKYGIRIGDRVQIGEVTGEVIELGLVRLYLMELGGRGLLGPTGRVVAFANSIVFQVSSGLFKQIQGVNFVWREIILNLPAGIDYAATKEKLTAALSHAIEDYRDEIVRQTKEIQRATASSSGGDAQPSVRLSFSAAGVEAHIRYPVHLQNAAEIDERVSQSLLAVITTLDAGSKAVRPAQA